LLTFFSTIGVQICRLKVNLLTKNPTRLTSWDCQQKMKIILNFSNYHYLNARLRLKRQKKVG
jgi:hypothetical protein